MFKTTLNNISLGLMLFFCSLQVFANSEQEKQMPCHSNKSQADNTVQKAKATRKLAPKYPIDAARIGQEGWVRLSFVIKKDGSVDLPIIKDSSGIKSFEKAAKRAVKSWKFDPATRGGKTIEQCQNSVQLDFKMGGNTKKSATRGFVKKYRQVHQFLTDKKLAEAKLALDKLATRTRHNFYEDRFFFSLKARYYQTIGDKRQELITLNKIVPEGKDYLPEETYVYSIVRAFQLAMLNNELSSSLYFYDKLKQFDANNEKVTALAPYIEKIDELIDSSEHIFVTAQINERNHWNHYLARKSFTIANIEGKLDSVDIRCDNHFSTYALDSEKEWNIPANWGKCQLFVKGEQGVKFNLIELASKQV